jgi:hypothetical protein
MVLFDFQEGIRVMVFNGTFNIISVISWWPVLMVEQTGVPEENHRPVASHWKFYHILLYRVHLAIKVVIDTDCKSIQLPHDH